MTQTNHILPANSRNVYHSHDSAVLESVNNSGYQPLYSRSFQSCFKARCRSEINRALDTFIFFFPTLGNKISYEN